MEGNKKEAKLIFNAGTCRSLLKAGCTIIDVKPDRENPIKSVFVFKCDEHFGQSLNVSTKKLQKQRLFKIKRNFKKGGRV